jgi:hypothetical protein
MARNYDNCMTVQMIISMVIDKKNLINEKYAIILTRIGT